MAPTDRIELRRVRDFGATINVVFEFLRQNWRQLGRSLLLIMAPMLVIVAAATGLYMRTFLSDLSPTAAPGPSMVIDTYARMAPMIVMASAVFVVALSLMFSIIGGYVRLYQHRHPEPIGVDDVWAEVRHTFGRSLVTVFVAYLLVMLPIVAGILPGALTGSLALIPLGVFLGMFVSLYLYVPMSIIVPMRLEEEIGVFAAITRARRLVSGRWWFTFWLFLVMSIILAFASIVFQVPLQAVAMFQGLSGEAPSTWLLFAAAGFYALGSYLLYSIILLTSSVQYYNLVEQKEGVGMSERINEIGAPVDDATHSPL